MAIKTPVKDILKSNIFGGADETKKSKRMKKGQISSKKNLILEVKESLQSVSPNTKYNEQYPLTMSEHYLSMLSPITQINESLDLGIKTNDELILESPQASPSLSAHSSLSPHEHNSSISSIESLNSSQSQPPDTSQTIPSPTAFPAKRKKSIELDERPKKAKKTKKKSKKKNKTKNKNKNKNKTKNKGKNNNKQQKKKKQKKKNSKPALKKRGSSSVPEPSQAPKFDYSDLFGDDMVIGAIKSKPKEKKDKESIFDTNDISFIGKITSKPNITSQYNDLNALGGIGKITSTTYNTSKAVVNVKNTKTKSLKIQKNKPIQRSFTTTAITDMENVFDLSDLGIDNLDNMDNSLFNQYDIDHISEEDDWISGDKDDDGYHSGSYSDSYTHSSRSYSSCSDRGSDTEHEQPETQSAVPRTTTTTTTTRNTEQQQQQQQEQIQKLSVSIQELPMIEVDEGTESESMTWSDGSDLEMPEPKPSQLEIEIQESKSRQASRVSTPVIAMADVMKTHELFTMDNDKVTAEEEKQFQDNRQKQFMDDLDAFFDDEETEEEEDEPEVNTNTNTHTADQKIQENETNETELELKEEQEQEQEKEAEPAMDAQLEADVAMETDQEIHEPVVERKKMRLGLVMKKFEINNKKYLKKYYMSLGIEYAEDFVDHEPSEITKPSSDEKKLKKELGTQTRMRISKMAKWIICKCNKGRWDGKYKQEWLNMEDNTITYTFGQTSLLPRRISLNSREDLNRFDLENKGCLKGNQRTIINKEIYVTENKIILVKIEQMAEITDGNRIRIGVIFYNKDGIEIDMLWIDDIMQIQTMDNTLKGYLCLSNNQKQMDTDSEIKLNIDNNISTPSVTFSHGRNNRIYKHHKQEYFMDNILKQNVKGYAKVFIEQMEGEGIYQVFEQELKSIKKSNLPKKTNKDRLKAKALMKKRRSRNKLNQNRNVRNVNINNKRSSKSENGKPKRRVSI